MRSRYTVRRDGSVDPADHQLAVDNSWESNYNRVMTTNNRSPAAVGAPDSIAARVGSGKSQYPIGPSLLDAEYYRDPAQFHRELSAIFHTAWLPACRSADLARPRDYVVWDRFGQSVLIARTDEGNLTAWHNVCQHRGAKLVHESGRCPSASFKCPWHGFAYDLEGKVTHAPLAEAFDSGELAGLRAPQVQVCEWSGLAWLTLDTAPRPLEEYLGELFGELAGYRLDGWEFRYQASWRIEANWKTVIDAFNETWHVPFTHKNTVRGGLLWRDAALGIMDPHSMMAIPVRRYLDVARPDQDHREHMLCHYLAFPNTIFNAFPTHVQIFSAWPDGPRATVLSAYGGLAPRAEDIDEATWSRRGDEGWEQFLEVVLEDVAVLEDAGRVYDSLGFRRQMFNAAEGRLTAFHHAVNERTRPNA